MRCWPTLSGLAALPKTHAVRAWACWGIQPVATPRWPWLARGQTCRAWLRIAKPIEVTTRFFAEQAAVRPQPAWPKAQHCQPVLWRC